MTLPPIAQPAQPQCALDAEGRIAQDIACVRCGYNLRGLVTTAICPECGTDIQRSLYGGMLAYADPSWLARIARGATWTVRGINVLLLALIAMVVSTVVLIGRRASAVSTPSPVAPSMSAGLIVATILGVIGAVLLVLGYWWLTEPDPGRPDEDADQRARQMGRIGLFGAMLAGLFLPYVVKILPGPAIVRLVAHTACHVLEMSLLIVATIGFFTYLARLSQRMPNMELTQKARSIRKGLVVCLALYMSAILITQIIVLVMRARTASTPAPGAGVAVSMAVPGCFSGLMFLALLIYMNRALRLLMRYRKDLRTIVIQAKHNWSPH